MSQSWMLALGRSLIGLLFLVAGIRKIMFFAGTAGYLAKLGFPAAEAMAVLAIIIEVGAGAMLVAGWKTKWASWALLVFTVIATVMAHRFWQFDATQYGNQLNHFLKNLAVIGGLLYVISFGPGARSPDGGKGGG